MGPLIVQIRGTSGSGKTTAMREVIRMLGNPSPWLREGRKRPRGYFLPGEPLACVLGHYETPTGGCDTIGSAPEVYRALREALDAGAGVVLCEGLLLSEDVKWTSRMAAEGMDVRVVFLTTPLEECLRGVEARRRAAGNEKPLNPENTSHRVGVIERARVKLNAAGVVCRRAPASQAPALAAGWVRAARGAGEWR